VAAIGATGLQDLGGLAAVPERHRNHPGQRDPDRRRQLRQPAHRVRHRPRWRPVRPSGLGRPARRLPEWRLPRRRRRRLVRRRRPAPAGCKPAPAGRPQAGPRRPAV